MAKAFIPGLQAAIGVVIEKTRELPIAGEVLCKVGEQVDASRIVCRALLPGDLHILRVAERLGIESFEALAGIKALQVAKGGEIKKDQVLCEHSGLFGLFRSRFASPASGTVEFISETNAHIGLREAPIPLDVNAYIAGEVTAIVPSRSVTIRSRVALVQGIFGVGGERTGVLKFLKNQPGQEVREGDIPGDAEGKILVGGTRPHPIALKKAEAAGAVGFVTGAIDNNALKSYLGYDLGIALTGDEEVKMSVIVTEGFGNIPLSDRVLNVLRPFEGQPASINGATQVRAGAIRPEIIVPQVDVAAGSATIVPGLDIGSRVRLIRVPYFGGTGVVTALPHEAQKIPTGAYCRVLKAKLDDGEEVTVPRANVELI